MMASKKWTIATARQHLPTLIASAAREPQRVYRRAELVATVVSPETAAAIAEQATPSLADELAELQRLCAEEAYELPVVARRDRANPIAARSRGTRSRTRAKR
ncbi:MAG TPA: hypothetical protein VHE35_19270 [Kofleriaceae bacterium]|nr:hypothetical protein [Kofleriaceae bacterium]